MMSSASFVLCSPKKKKSYHQEVRIVIKVKGFVRCWIPGKVKGCPKRSKKKIKKTRRFGHQSLGEAADAIPGVPAG